jgi:hypothetical protein
MAFLESELNEAIFDLYKLTESERDLIRDMCEIGIEFFYRSFGSRAAQPIQVNGNQLYGRYDDLPETRSAQDPLQAYLYAFLKIWNNQLSSEGQFQWRIVQPGGDFPLLAITFHFQPTEQQSHFVPEYEEWLRILQMLEEDLLYPFDGKQIYLDGMVRAVTINSSIIIIKRNELRLWTRSVAREDAEATLVQAMNVQEVGRMIREHDSSSHDPVPLVG